MFGELWTEEDVAEMCEIDFDEDLIVTYKQGSEMPQSNMDRELRFMQGINALMPLITAGVPVAPDKFQKILEKIDEMAGFDFDLTGLEVNELIAQKRYLELAALCVEFGDVPFEQVEAEKQNVIAVDMEGQPITQMDLITEQIFARSQIRFSQYEDLEQQKVFFIEMLRAETGKSKPNYVLLEMLNVVIGFIEQAVNEIAMQKMMADPEYQAAMAADAAAKDAEAANVAREDEKAGLEREDQETERMIGLAQTAAGQEHELEKIRVQGEVDKEKQPK